MLQYVTVCAGAVAEVHAALAAAKEAAQAARAPFQWMDGPLVTAMRQGDIILIDELNLAEDAVLERMNRCDTLREGTPRVSPLF